MNAKKTLVSLTCKELRETRLFEVEHAERLLSMFPNGGWEISEDESYYLKEDGKISRRNTGDIQKADQSEMDTESEGTGGTDSLSRKGKG
jgi:hypothetical protein